MTPPTLTVGVISCIVLVLQGFKVLELDTPMLAQQLEEDMRRQDIEVRASGCSGPDDVG